MYQLSNYDIFINSRPKCGTLIYVHKDLQANEVKTLNDTDCNESVWVGTIKLSSGAKLLLGCIYRSPNSDDENNVKLNELVCKADLFPAKYKCIVAILKVLKQDECAADREYC